MVYQPTLEDMELTQPKTGRAQTAANPSEEIATTFFNGVYQNKAVLVTGHTGFKGSWLCLWLKQLGANVIGLSKDIPSSPSHFELLNIGITDLRGDVADANTVRSVMQTYKPDVVFHMAAQALVRYSYSHPSETFRSNVMGTVEMLNNALAEDAVKAFVNITSDKAYENREWVWGYRENDPMGGFDPYSASKGCAELVTSSFRNSFFSKTNKLLASARAGNVIGGGDWAADRLVPDICKAAAEKQIVKIRNPHATRPWQHVLEPLSGYLLLGQKLLEGDKAAAEGWNFGPADENTCDVKRVVDALAKHWPNVRYEIDDKGEKPHEANLLRLDCSKAHQRLQWKSVWNFDQTVEKTAAWYRDFYAAPEAFTVERSLEDLSAYTKEASSKKLVWTQQYK